jgi:hypothetical protein
MAPLDLCLIRSQRPGGEPLVELGVPLLDDYLRFVAARCRPSTVLAAAYDLKVFFTVVGKHPQEVRPADVLAFVTAQRAGGASIDGLLQSVDDDGCRRCPGCTRSCTPVMMCRPIRSRMGCRPGGSGSGRPGVPLLHRVCPPRRGPAPVSAR